MLGNGPYVVVCETCAKVFKAHYSKEDECGACYLNWVDKITQD